MGRRLGTSRSDLVEEEEVRHVSGVVVAPMCLKAAKIVLHIIGGAYVSICASYTHNYRRRIMRMRLALSCHGRTPGPQKV